MSGFSSATIGRSAGFWLIVTAAIELALAGVFLVIGLTVPIVDVGMFLTGAILGITGLVLLVIGIRVRASAAANERLLSEGLPGTATVAALTQTGMYLNENPQVAIDLMVDVAGRPPYPVTRKEFVPLILLGRLGSGAPLPVRVDRANPQRLVIDWGNAGLASAPAIVGLPGATTIDLRGMGLDPQAIAGAISAAMAGGTAVAASDAASGSTLAGGGSAAPATAATAGGSAAAGMPVALPAGVLNMGSTAPLAADQFAQMRAWLRQTGIPATARIDQAMDMGSLVGSDRLFTVQATLEIAGRGPEKLQPVAALVAPEDVDKVREGYRVPVRVAPDNHQLIDFDW